MPEKWKGDVIAQYHSSLDKDGDGIDDQVDILEGAIAYVNTHPKYKSAYYAGGYPMMDMVSVQMLLRMH